MDTFIGALILLFVTGGLPLIFGIIALVLIVKSILNWKKTYCPRKWYQINPKKHEMTDWYHQDHSQPECMDYEEWEERRCVHCGYIEQREIPQYKELEK